MVGSENMEMPEGQLLAANVNPFGAQAPVEFEACGIWVAVGGYCREAVTGKFQTCSEGLG